MGKRDIIEVAVRIIGINFAISVLPSFISFGTVFCNEIMRENSSAIIMMLLANVMFVLFYFGAGYLLIIKAKWIAGMLYSEEDNKTSINIKKEELLDILIIFIGVYALLDSIKLGVQISVLILNKSQYYVSGASVYFNDQIKKDLITFCLKVGLGIYLIVGSKKLSDYILKIRKT